MSEADPARTIDFTHAGALGDAMFPVLNHWRETEPVRWDESGQCWIVTRHADITEGLSGRLPLGNRRLERASLENAGADLAAIIPNLMKYSPYHITNMDPPEHPRMRKLMSKAFGRAVVEGLRPFAKAKVDELIDLIATKGTVEFNEEIGRALPGSVILKLLNLPQDILPKLRDWANDVMTGLGTPNPLPEWVAGADRAFAEMTVVFEKLVADRRRNLLGPEDFVSALITAREGADSLSDEEIIATLQVALVAGHDTTGNSMTLGTVALSRHPEGWAFMHDHPDQMLPSVIELMRFSAMSAAQNRVVSADFEWHGQQLKKGDVVYLMLAAGNRDPRMYENPEALDMTRPGNDRALIFAPGVHHCIGHLLAKMQLTEFFGALTRRFSGAEVLAPVVYSPILVFRAIPEIPIRFIPR